MLPPKRIDKNAVAASDVTNTAAEVGRIRLRRLKNQCRSTAK